MTNQLREVVADALPEDELVALVAGPYMYHHKMDEAAMREAAAFDRCRELTIQNIRTWCATRRAMLATLPTQSAGVEERAHVFSDYSDHCRRCGSINIGGKCTPASEGDGGRVVEWQIMRPAFVTADENYSGKRVAAVYADASMIGQRVRLIFDTTPPAQQEARAVGDAEILAQAWDIARNSGTNWNLYTAEDFMDAVMAQARAMNTQPGSPT